MWAPNDKLDLMKSANFPIKNQSLSQLDPSTTDTASRQATPNLPLANEDRAKQSSHSSETASSHAANAVLSQLPNKNPQNLQHNAQAQSQRTIIFATSLRAESGNPDGAGHRHRDQNHSYSLGFGASELGINEFP